MSKPVCAALCVMLVMVSVPALAQDSQPPPPSSPAAAPASQDDTLAKAKHYFLSRPNNQPSRLERLIVAGVASVLAVGALGVGIGVGIWAYMDYQCLKNVSACNKTRADNQQISGTNFLRYRADGERKAIVADMGYLAAATATAVAVLGVASAFWPAGWWPFASDDQPVDVPPRQVVTELPPPAPMPAPAPATTTPPTTDAPPPANTPTEGTAPTQSPMPSSGDTNANTGTPGTGSAQ